jgi:hypothetical protein
LPVGYFAAGATSVLSLRARRRSPQVDQQFASRSITPEALKDATTKIGVTQAELRNAHLKYHLETAQILSPDQMKQYADLRGHTPDAPAKHHRMHYRDGCAVSRRPQSHR